MLQLAHFSIDDHQPAERSQSNWRSRYGDKHGLRRLTDFPKGLTPPRRVRIYERDRYYVLQWWDPQAKRTLSERVDGDLLSALVRARQIDERLDLQKSSGQGQRRVGHRELVAEFVKDLNQRANARELAPGSVTRYESALQYYLGYTNQTAVDARYPLVAKVNRQFALEFAAYLADLRISPNGHRNVQKRRVASASYVESVVRSMFAWAADPDRGNLLPVEFRNPFKGAARAGKVQVDMFGEPDITIGMAEQFLSACDPYQLRLFALLVFYGLRASEPCFLFREYLSDDWLKVPCNPNLHYLTKGRRDKRLPLIEPLTHILSPAIGSTQGILFVQRRVGEEGFNPPLLQASLGDLERELDRRCGPELSARDRERVRDALLKDTGAINYDAIEHEFHHVVRQLGWPPTATVKDFRHLFASTMQNAGMPEFYRRYLMGQSPGRAAIVDYTHLNELREIYEDCARRKFQTLLECTTHRARELGLI